MTENLREILNLSVCFVFMLWTLTGTKYFYYVACEGMNESVNVMCYLEKFEVYVMYAGYNMYSEVKM